MEVNASGGISERDSPPLIELWFEWELVTVDRNEILIIKPGSTSSRTLSKDFRKQRPDDE
jgi:hypothetical protein